ncbi:MAG TPA: protein kinase, partial [Polyangiaceae bacterium]|nr:protein kinase [Polyangiaceae bacterium]
MSSEGSPPAPEGSTELGSAAPSSAPDSLLREVAHISEVAVGPVADGPEGRKLGHYLVGRRIGRGGMGDVYEATDARLGRKVALKVLPASFAASDERRRRFLREARAAAAVSHPNITVIYDVGDDEGTVFIAM